MDTAKSTPTKGTNASHGRAGSTVLGVLAAVALAIAFVFAGLLACMAPPTTRIFSRALSLDDLSPYTKDELVVLADAGRSYAFGAHDAAALKQAEAAAQESLVSSGRYTREEFSAAYADAPAMFELTPDALAHLDDCYRVISAALPWLIGDVILAIVLLVLSGLLGRRKLVGGVLVGAGAVTLALLIGVGLWLVVDFDGFFQLFHSLFFQAGTWKFPYDSLLICMYPESFWQSMAALWAAVSAALSIISLVIGIVQLRISR